MTENKQNWIIFSPKLDLVSTNVYIKFDQNPSFGLKILKGNKILMLTKGHNAVES